MFFDSDMDNDDDSDSIPEYPSLAHLQQPTIQEVVSDEEKETNVSRCITVLQCE